MKSYWLNIPVKDVRASMDFFKHIGFEVNAGEDEALAQVIAGEQPILLFREDVLQSFMGGELTDTKAGNEFIVSFNMERNKEVDDLCKRITSNGGRVLEGPAEIRGYYGCLFTDLDGHKYNVLVM
ncbi:VOC family protein [Salinicoccus carnicancri]|uniref:VOC family protein n=1 Tax=Salinicoccus carnicancri TaxID=558170 RepID=UPI0002FDA728|nr:VOC family protein [Salinicoccus carnicancri]